MPYINKIEIMGNLGKDPELRHMPDGTPVAKINVAVSEKWTDKSTGEIKEHTEWFSVLLYNRHAETVCRHMKKGDTVLVYGRLRTRLYTDKAGAVRSVTEVVCNEMQIIRTAGHARQGVTEENTAGGIYSMM
ncbi:MULTISPECIES: single-stranded DNA-binding protein [unclassified Neisseria]|uniref:single-stranded DNA-binding protein n=1 Tax=unclassified Neisseria TaxID=2623750 RepID=UPI001072BCF5|nr:MULTISPECIES: single-stranded DNA-binding protein [unclassified Neisseria]MBF0805065.1 single-stranded DNA-binding protein [Neisseria sp. 19428wB4_WF04]TFU38534.1 single-stranded DNA-binding protein [Neisseria sp. WF04]